MVYKLGLISTHGTGKTTMAHLVAGELKKKGFRVRVIPEVATEAKETGKIINQNTRLIDQAWILLTQSRYELEAEMAGYDIIICDRTVHDNYCYLENSCGKNDHYKNFVLNHSKQHPYKIIYRIPISIKPQEDGIRSISEEFQILIDNKLDEYLKKEEINYINLPKLEEKDEERIKWVNFIVNNTLKDLDAFSKYNVENELS